MSLKINQRERGLWLCLNLIGGDFQNYTPPKQIHWKVPIFHS